MLGRIHAMGQARIVALLIMLCVVRAPAAAPTTRPAPAASEDGIAVYFSPNGGAADAVIAATQSSKRTLDIAAYSMTHTGIAKATADAHKRGVKVRVIMDKTQSSGRYSSATYLFNAGVAVESRTLREFSTTNT